MDEEQEIQQAVGQYARVVATTVARLAESALRAAQVVAERERALEENRAAHDRTVPGRAGRRPRLHP